MNWEKIEELIEQGYIRKRKHPTLPLWIYNYTHLAQFDKLWTEETLTCRGLVADEDGKIHALPFKKFFNIEEHQYMVPGGRILCTEKMDGSLGILFRYPQVQGDELVFASRGSFDSDQAKEMEQIWGEKYSTLPINPGYTYLFEIIYPENRIVVDYGDARKLVLLGVINTETGKDGSEDVDCTGFDLPLEYSFRDVSEILSLQHDPKFSNLEGFVVRFPDADDFRVKIKLGEYVRLHRLITQASSVSIWEALMNNDPLEEMLAKVPDEFYAWVQETKLELEKEFKTIKSIAERDYQKLLNQKLETRKEQALWIQENVDVSFIGMIFAQLDNKPIDKIIWKMIRPAYEKPFWNKEIES